MRRYFRTELQRPVGGARTGRDVDKMGRFEDLKTVPHALRHDECVARLERMAGLGARVVEVAIVEDNFESAGDEIQKFVTIGMQLTAMRGRRVHAADDANGKSVDADRPRATLDDG
jgi:hypothetical protein